MKQGVSQAQAILAYLKAGHSLTKLESIKLFDCMNLGGRCWDLKQAGHDVQTEMIELPNGKRIARYSIAQLKGQLTLFGNPATTAANRGATAISPQGADHARAFQ